MTRHHPEFAKQTGVTLLENMIALVVLSVGLLGLAGLQAYTLRSGSGTQVRLYAMQQAEDMAGRIRANLTDVYAVTSAYQGVVPVASPVSPKDCRTNTCTAVELANFDVSQWQVANNLLFPGDHNLIGGYIQGANVTDMNGNPMGLWFKSPADIQVPPNRKRYIITMVWNGDLNASAVKPVNAENVDTCPARTNAYLNCYKLVVDL